MTTYFAHNLLLLLLSPLIAVYLGTRYLSGRSRPGWRERWGYLPERLHARPDGRPRIWVHAVSAGEVVAAVPILRELRARSTEHDILFSVVTPAGYEMACQQAAPYVDGIFYAPFDFPPVVQRVIRLLQPDAYVSLESELWPNLLYLLKQAQAVTVLVNGRLSERNYRRARRFAPGWMRWMLGHVDCLLMQSGGDAMRVQELLGSAKAPGRIQVIGNSKFDQEIPRLTPGQVDALRIELQLPREAPVFVAGSTRSPEEEAVVIRAYCQLRTEYPELCLIIAPRQIDRAEAVAQAMRAAGLHPVRRTRLQGASGPVQHLILDTMGELACVYAVATVAFVGNSFPPVVKGGGQNLLQPLAHGKPVLFGPFTATIRSEVALAVQHGVGFPCPDGNALVAQARTLLANGALRCEIEQRAVALIAAHRGASARYAQEVIHLIQNRKAQEGEKK
ncbi:MAG: glycosyltransferase N-terminal domain-containing protein [Chloroherpetonaceae bacterium]|nr:glycosyltransferase N-terminal domain-containing protein [Chloroherpetonaceae bacterium]